MRDASSTKHAVQPEPAHIALAYIGQLYAVEREAKTLVGEDDLVSDDARQNWHRRRHELRQEKSLSTADEFHDWLTAAKSQDLPKSPIGQAIGHVLRRWDGLTRYCENGALSIDYNLSERTVRPVAIGRNNWIFLGSDNGGKAAVLFSLAASAKANQVERFANVRVLLMRLSDRQFDHLSNLLADEWLKTHPDARRNSSRQ